MKTVFSFLFGWGCAMVIFYFILVPHLEMARWEAEDKAQGYLIAIKEGELHLNDSVASCEGLVKDWQKKLNAVCDKYKIRNCVVPVRAEYPRYFFSPEDSKWMIQNGTGYTPI